MNTRQVTIKNTKDLPNIGVPVYLQVTDDKIEAVVIGDGADSIRICKATEYSQHLKVTTQQAKKTKEVFVVEGKLLELSDYCSEDFDTEFKAQEHLHSLHAKYAVANLGLKVVSKVVEYFEDKLV